MTFPRPLYPTIIDRVPHHMNHTLPYAGRVTSAIPCCYLLINVSHFSGPLKFRFFVFPSQSYSLCTMARVTRRSSQRLLSLSETTTPTSNASPYISSRAESLRTESIETPATSDVEDELNLKPSPVKRRYVTRNKRLAEDDKDNTESVSAAPAPKRRAVSRQIYVSVPLAKSKPMEQVCDFIIANCNQVPSLCIDFRVKPQGERQSKSCGYTCCF